MATLNIHALDSILLTTEVPCEAVLHGLRPEVQPVLILALLGHRTSFSIALVFSIGVARDWEPLPCKVCALPVCCDMIQLGTGEALAAPLRRIPAFCVGIARLGSQCQDTAGGGQDCTRAEQLRAAPVANKNGAHNGAARRHGLFALRVYRFVQADANEITISVY